VLAAGIFLSMAAITALPRLRQDDQPNEDVSATALEADLRQVQISTKDIAGYYSQPRSPLAEARSISDPPTAAGTDTVPQSAPSEATAQVKWNAGDGQASPSQT
jgi:hypothetical protein